MTVNVDDKDTRAIQAEWERRQIPVPLTVVDSPYREITRPIIDFVKSAAPRTRPRDVVTVFIPEYVVGRWWENLLHNQSALRIKGRLLFEPGVMVTSVPWQLRSSQDTRPGPLRPRPEPGAGPRPARRGAERPRRAATADDHGRPPRDRLTGRLRRGRHGRADRRGAGARRALRGPDRRRARPGGVRPARAARRAGHRARSPSCTRATCAPTRSRCTRPSPDRVTPPCPYAHARWLRRLRPAARRRRRAAGLEDRRRARAARAAGRAEPTAEVDALGRTRGAAARRPARLAVPGAVRGGRRRPGRAAPAPLARGGRRSTGAGSPHPAMQALDVTAREWPDADAVEVVASTGGDVTVLTRPTGGQAGRRARPRCASWPPAGSGACRRTASGRSIRPRPTPWSRRCWTCCDPAAGRDGLGPVRRRRAVRRGAGRTDRRPGSPWSSRRRSGWRRPGANLADLPGVEVVAAKVDVALARRRITGPVDLVVLDPPRTGAGRPGGPGDRRRRVRGRSPTWPATRPRWPGTSRRSRELGWRAGASCAATTASR